jgi:hypothetical protein
MTHAVIIRLELSDRNFGTEAEREAIFELTDRMEAAISAADAGEFDGNEFGGGECTLYMYGSDADGLYGAVVAILQGSRLSRGGSVIKRYGDADDPHAREVKLPI